MRGAICNFIDRATPFKACCEAGNGEAAVAKARERAPALVIVDLSMPMLYGVETASALHSMVPSAKIIGLAMFAGEYRRTQLAAAGFHMIVSKSEALAKLAEAIKVLLPHAEPQAAPPVSSSIADDLKAGASLWCVISVMATMASHSRGSDGKRFQKRPEFAGLIVLTSVCRS